MAGKFMRKSVFSAPKHGLRRWFSTPYRQLSPMENMLTVKEVAALLRVSTQTLYKMLEQGEIPAVKIGSQWRFDREKIKAWIDSRGVDSEPGRTPPA